MTGYLSITETERAEMLSVIGANSVEELFSDIPKDLLLKNSGLDTHKSQQETEAEITALAEKNKVYKKIFRGAGSYNHYIPAVVKSLTSRSEFLTAYTPYQAEMSQGILQAIFEYQSYITALTGMDASNASHYSGATAAVESVYMTVEKNRRKFLYFDNIRPDTEAVFKTYCERKDIMPIKLKSVDGGADMNLLRQALSDEICAVYVESPNYFGIIENISGIADAAHERGAKVVASMNPVALAILETPGAAGADIACGEGQPLGLEMSFGGPYLGFIGCRTKDIRKMPGRIVGETTDKSGKRAFCLTLQAREQHIRREKALSNICSNEAHCALTATVYLAAMGRGGLKNVAENSVRNAHYLADKLCDAGLCLKYGREFFHEFVTVSDGKAYAIEQALSEHNILSGLPLNADETLWCATETVDKKDIDTVFEIVAEVINGNRI